MRGGSRGGRRAAQPDADWTPPERLLADGVSVRFVEERGGRERVFSFAELPVEPAVAQWLARAFARRTGPRHGMKKLRSAESFFHVASFFAEVLARQRRLVMDTAGVSVAHIEAFRDRYDGLRSQGSYVDTLRSLLRDDPELPKDVRAALVQARVPSTPDAQAPTDREYADAEWQQLMTALRSDVRIARDRIRAGRELLHRFRVDPPGLDGEERQVGRLLDGFDRTGEVPRYRGGAPTNEVYAAGGAASLGARLCLTLHEMTAFALLLTALTGENFGTVTAWPAAHYRPDGRTDSTGIVLVEAVKPRRGPEREHMVTALEDLPAGLAEVLTASDDHSRRWRSPLRVYHLLLELTQVSRRHGGHRGVCSAYTPHPGRFGSSCWVCGVGAHQVRRWARHHGFPPRWGGGDRGRPAADRRPTDPADSDRAAPPPRGAHPPHHERPVSAAEPAGPARQQGRGRRRPAR